jgi:hypothetical protein
MLWKQLARLASKAGIRSHTPKLKWIAHEDLENFCHPAGLEIIRRDMKMLCPIRIPLLATFLNRYLAPLPFFRLFTMLNIVIARPLKSRLEARPSVSVIVPARNESGNINDILARCPMMGPENEIIFVEGNSTDDTWERIQEAASTYRRPHGILIAQQNGRGQADAVIGSRFMGGRPHRVLFFWHMVGNKFLTLLLNIFTNINLTDMERGYKAFKAPLIKSIQIEEDRFGVEPEIIAKLPRTGCRIYEVGISYSGRTMRRVRRSTRRMALGRFTQSLSIT